MTKLRNSLSPAHIDASIFLATNTMLPGARFPVAATGNAVEQGAGLAEELEKEECLPPLPDLPSLLQSTKSECCGVNTSLHCLIIIIILLYFNYFSKRRKLILKWYINEYVLFNAFYTETCTCSCFDFKVCSFSN